MYIGLDLGTSSLKALLVDDAERVLAEHTVGFDVSRPAAGWVEQDPAAWVSAAQDALRALRADNDLRELRAIGLSGHMHGATLLDESGAVLRPCMLWNDTRAAAEAAEMDSDPRFREITGNIVFPGFTAPKVEWVRRHEPEIFARTAHILLPKDYLRYALTGALYSEMSDAAGTAWLDTGRRDWSDDLLAACGLSRENMPKLVEGSAPTAGLRDKLAVELDLPDVWVAGGAGDNAAAAIGAGVVRDGEAFLSLGTSGVLFAANDGYRPDPATAVHTFCHAVPGTWHQMGVILAAADALEWLSRLTGRSAAELTSGLGPLRAPSRVLFLPYLGGERTPHNDAAIRGQFLNLDHATDATEAARAVLEGVAFAFADSRDALAATGTRINRALALGGGSRSGYWLDLLSSVLGFPLDVPEAGEFGAALGAARLGRMAATGEGAEIATQPAIAHSHDPDPALADACAEGLARYRAAYAAIRGL
ncbi:xylulokinase [Roseisalinus antarcticus]|uniref:Xylulose kinase n=1 Tax=Roseisalinus antarcticus TaxID=254357 RepID=A0A1Y5TXZ5_9RHOB|nr:xylulokinase [Roseisalinus antarcticus]SLN76635.1 Xylulose kinase [Roseisalinus antarcticus]